MKRFLFLVQGEGRGHLTQALALAQLLRADGHEVCAACVGMSPMRDLPAFFEAEIAAPVVPFDEPSFQHQGRRIHTGATLVQALRRLPSFHRSLATLDDALAHYRPDVVVNFFTLLGGLHKAVRRPPQPFVCVGHQYLFDHPVYPFPAGRPVARAGARAYTRLTALGATRRLALSFYPAPALPAHPGLHIVPPLLRDTVRQQPVRDDGFLLVYLLNPGYADDVRAWSAAHPGISIHCFRDAPGGSVAETDALTFHPLDGTRFVAMMARCHGLVCTAGFESVCEAMYLGKPALMVPVEAHFEQQCNAHDAAQTGAGIASTRFDLGLLLDAAGRHQPVPGFRAWVDEAADHFLHHLAGPRVGASVLRPARPTLRPNERVGMLQP